ncbi:Ribosome maturation protein SDO1 [Astathelohania contejeani]|uniref:Ribosome maturation protein SDO1 n=1 Tax=Astathelohania contejeani TaxID=164912 RepID=A0ABQ7I0C5_9MICR|nr:Ribosome maturation protein SDO1 [Thelohania contejeani]
MNFTPENLKKLTNVNIVSLKRYGKKFQLALFPNKLYEYRNNITTDLSQILHTKQIFKNVSKGELCNKKDLAMFNCSHDEIIELILKYGIEQKDIKTRLHELNQIEKEIVQIIKTRIMDQHMKYLDDSVAFSLIKCYPIDINKNPKVQANDIIKMLLHKGYKKIKMKIRIETPDYKLPDIIKYEIIDGVIHIDTDDYKEFEKYCKSKNYKFTISLKEDVGEEEIF